jgi:hypothetical protein
MLFLGPTSLFGKQNSSLQEGVLKGSFSVVVILRGPGGLGLGHWTPIQRVLNSILSQIYISNFLLTD